MGRDHGFKLGALAAALVLSGTIAPQSAQAGHKQASWEAVQNTFPHFQRKGGGTANSGSVGNSGAICACITAVAAPLGAVNTITIAPPNNTANGTLLLPRFGQ
jgi:hypothetical protein